MRIPLRRVSMLPKQAWLAHYNKKWGGARGGVSAAKTHGFVIWLLKRLKEYPRQQAFVVGATNVQLQNGFFATLLGVLDDIGARGFRYRESPTPMLVFANGSRIRSMVASQAERIRSVEIDTLLLEEPQTWPNGQTVYDVLVGRLRTSPVARKHYGDKIQPQGRMSFNPPAEGHWIHGVVTKVWPKLGYECIQMSVRDNFLMPRQHEYVRGLEAQYSADRVKVDIDGEWATAGGNVYSSFDSKIHLTAPDGMPAVDAIDESKPLLWAHDFNVALMCSLIAQPYTQTRLTDGFAYHENRPPTQFYRFPIPGWQRRIIRVIGELAVFDAGTPNVFRAFMEKYGDIARRTGVVLFGDASGGARQQSADSASSGRTNWLDLETRLRKAGIQVSMQIPKANPSIIDRINETNAQFGTGDGYGTTINGAECPVLIKDLREVKRDKNGKIEKLPGTLLTHMSDAFGCLCYRQRELGRLADLKAREKKRGQTTIFMNR